MKAVVLKEAGGPEKLIYEEVKTPTPEAGEVLVKLKYAALNRRDLFNTYGVPGVKLPAIPGSDGTGTIVELGENVQDIEVGSNVIINPGVGWGVDDKKPDPNFYLFGLPKQFQNEINKKIYVNGTFAQYMIVPAENIHPKPNYLTWEEAAVLSLAGVTAYRSLISKGQVQKGETVLIPGIGSGVALFVLQMCVAIGANVYVTSGNEEKIERAKQLGAVGGVNYRSPGWSRELREMMGSADLIVDGVAGEGFNILLDLVAEGGRVITYGETNGSISQFMLSKIFMKNLDVKGTKMGSPREFVKMLEFFETYHIRPVIDRCYPLDQAAEALTYMQEGGNFGKIVLSIPG